MSTILAIIAGIICGVAAFYILNLSRKFISPATLNRRRGLAVSLVLVAFSFIFLAFSTFIVYKISVELTLPFGGAEIVSFLVVTLVFAFRVSQTYKESSGK